MPKTDIFEHSWWAVLFKTKPNLQAKIIKDQSNFGDQCVEIVRLKVKILSKRINVKASHKKGHLSIQSLSCLLSIEICLDSKW